MYLPAVQSAEAALRAETVVAAQPPSAAAEPAAYRYVAVMAGAEADGCGLAAAPTIFCRGVSWC